MIFNVLWPMIEFFAFWSMRQLQRVYDRGFTLNIKQLLSSSDSGCTKSITIYQYVDLYSGPIFMIHYKYAAIINVTLIAFMFGAGMPILFPITAIALAVLYVVEKLMIYYSYRQPPTYDSALNDSVLIIMSYAPVIFFSFGYW